jgi:hypothetical protein
LTLQPALYAHAAVVVASLPETVVPVPRVLKRVAARAGEIGPTGTVVPPGQVFLLGGDSMVPAFQDGDRVLVVRRTLAGTPKGDAKGSYDSRNFGPVAAGSIVGVVVFKLRPAIRKR